MNELKPCPFCGTTEHLSFQWPGSMLPDMPDRPCRVVCAHIDHDTVIGPTAYGRGAAIAAWDTRPALCDHRHFDRMALCNQCEAAAA